MVFFTRSFYSLSMLYPSRNCTCALKSTHFLLILTSWTFVLSKYAGWTIRSSNPGRGKGYSRLQIIQTIPEAHPASYSVTTQVPSRG